MYHHARTENSITAAFGSQSPQSRDRHRYLVDDCDGERGCDERRVDDEEAERRQSAHRQFDTEFRGRSDGDASLRSDERLPDDCNDESDRESDAEYETRRSTYF
jgi:hypothetical protein